MTHYCFDIDETICGGKPGRQYMMQKPFPQTIAHINSLHEEGHWITLYTARGSSSGIDWFQKTEEQLRDWGISYDELLLGKPAYDEFICDKAENAVDYRRRHRLDVKVGLVAGAFDVIHPGYIDLLKDAKTVCDFLIVAVHADPSHDRPNTKYKPVLGVLDRMMILHALKNVDKVVSYSTEEELVEILEAERPDVRILGDDYVTASNWTGKELKIPIYYHHRGSGWSATKFKQKIYESVKNKKKKKKGEKKCLKRFW